MTTWEAGLVSLQGELDMRSCSFLSFIVLSYLATTLCTGGDEGVGDSATPVAMKKYTVDLDKPPEERWLTILSEYKNSASILISYFNQSVSRLDSTLFLHAG